MLGAACDYRVGYLEPPAIRGDARIVRIDLDPPRLHQGPFHLSMLADPRRVLEDLTSACAALGNRPRTGWLKEARARQQAQQRIRLAQRGFGRREQLEPGASVKTDGAANSTVVVAPPLTVIVS
jgi:hypothetical protein